MTGRVVILDAGPLHYLAQLGHLEALRELFGVVLVPRAVLDELAVDAAPEIVRAVVAAPPAWLRVVDDVSASADTEDLDRGERQAFAIAMEFGVEGVEYVLCDDRRARSFGRRMGFAVVGTLGILDEAGAQRLLVFDTALDRLITKTNLRVKPAIVAKLRAAHRERLGRQ